MVRRPGGGPGRRALLSCHSPARGPPEPPVRTAPYMEVTTMMTSTRNGTRRTLLPRFVTPVLLGAFLALSSATALAGPVGFNAFGGWYTDPSNFHVGAGARFGLTSFTFNPNVEYLFVDSGTSYTLNLDGTMTLMPLGVGSVYAGGGVGWLTSDPDQGD